MNPLVYAVPAAGVVALIFAFIKSASVNKADAGTEEMKIIAGRIADGARAFLVTNMKFFSLLLLLLFFLESPAALVQTNPHLSLVLCHWCCFLLRLDGSV